MQLNSDFRDMCAALSAAGVDYLVVGAYAVAVYGHPRATGDLDVWVRISPESAERLMIALKDFGAPTANVSAEDFQLPDVVYQIGVPPGRIDILTSITGVGFAAAWDRRKVICIEGLDINIIGRADLIANKRATGRHKDIADVHALLNNTD